MSSDYERLIGRAVTGKPFRDALLADPEGAVKKEGFNITAQEMDNLKRGIKNLKTTPAELDQTFGTVAGAWS